MLPTFSDQITINVTFTNLIAAAAIVVVIFSVLGFYIFKLTRRINLLTPKFGFGGKKIVAVALLAFLAGALPFTAVLVLRSTEIRRQAREVREVDLSIQIIERTDLGAVVGFSSVPFENGIAWYQEDYKAVWEIEGPTSFSVIEEGLNKSNPSYFVKTLDRGEYKVSVNVTAKDFDVKEEDVFVIE